MKYDVLKTVPVAARVLTLLALMLNLASAAETATITGISAPSTPFSVIALNANGQVAGYYFDSEASQRAFLWNNSTAVELGTLGGILSVANCLNNAGQVAAFSSVAGEGEVHACVGTANGLVDLGTLGGLFSYANGINDSGTTVGQSYVAPGSSVSHAFVAVSGGALQDLGTLGGSSSSATAVNNAGHIIGDSSIAGDSEVHAFVHSGGVMRDLGTFGGPSSRAVALNALGQVTGESMLPNEDARAFLFDGNVVLNLGTLGGTRSTGRRINDQVEVIGDSETASGDCHGFIYRNGVMLDLGTLGGATSTAHDVNNLGQVVGRSLDANQQSRAFLWADGTMTDLNTLLPANSDWHLSSAEFINDNGQIVGQGFYQDPFQPTWFLLTLAANENHPPVANAGPDQTSACGVSEAGVTLDGSASSDPDGDALVFEWSEGGTVLGNSAVLNVTLASGSHTVTLRVTDTHNASTEDSVLVMVGVDNVPPVVECPAGRTVPAGERGRALVPNFLEGLSASDNCTAASALVKAQNPAAGTVVGCGTHTVTLTVVDAAGNRTTCSTTLSVVDVTSPVVRCPEEIFRRARTNCQAAVPDLTRRVFASDNCTPRARLRITQSPAPGTLVERGRHEITVTVADAAGNTAACTTVLHVVDLTRPVFSSLTASPSVLHANGKMVTVNLKAVVRDNCDPNPHCLIVWVSSSERQGESPDWKVTGDMTLQLRAQMISKRGPRVYRIVVACIDASGNFTLRSVHVKVTRD